MAYEPISWTNTPSTPLNADNLNHIEDGIIANEVAVNKVGESAVYFAEFLGKQTHATDIHTAANWSLYNGIVMTDNGDYVSFSGSATASSPQTFLLKLDSENLITDVKKSKFVLAKIRLRAVGADVKIAFRDNAFFNSNNTIATNSDSVESYSNKDALKDGVWRTIWTVTGGIDKTVSLLGVQPVSATADYELQVSSIDCYYSTDGQQFADVVSALESDVSQHDSEIKALQTGTEQQIKNITAVSDATNKNSDDISALDTRVTTAEGKIGTLEQKVTIHTSSLNSLAQRVGVLETDNTSNKSRLTEAEGSIATLSAKTITNASNIATNTTNITVHTNAIATVNQTIAANTADISDLQAYVGYTNDDILGLQVDYANKTFTRLAGAVGKEAGEGFDSFAMYGGRRRCNVANDGTINAYYGDEGYADDGSNGQVMVYQPAFYYKVVPLKLDKNTDSGIGYHIRKANYYVSATPHAGFKLHPAFYDENGNAVDYILYSAYEGSLYSSGHMVSDDTETSTTWDLSTDYLCSVASSVSNVKPISGLYKQLTRMNAETLAKNHGAGWHIDTIKSVSANQLLMMIELGTMNTQSAIGLGVVNITDNSAYNCASFTGSTADLGNSTGMAKSTTNRQGSTTTTYTENGKVAVSYRGIENPWGNIWKFVNGINIWGDGTMCGGQAYIADDFNFMESKQDSNYSPVGFTLPNANGFVGAMGYGGEKYDWLFLPSEVGGTSASPVGDFCYIVSNLTEYKICQLGGNWVSSVNAGGFCYRTNSSAAMRYVNFGARLLYVPAARI